MQAAPPRGQTQGSSGKKTTNRKSFRRPSSRPQERYAKDTGVSRESSGGVNKCVSASTQTNLPADNLLGGNKFSDPLQCLICDLSRVKELDHNGQMRVYMDQVHAIHRTVAARSSNSPELGNPSNPMVVVKPMKNFFAKRSPVLPAALKEIKSDHCNL